jgi:hypothetical protein
VSIFSKLVDDLVRGKTTNAEPQPFQQQTFEQRFGRPQWYEWKFWITSTLILFFIWFAAWNWREGYEVYSYFIVAGTGGLVWALYSNEKGRLAYKVAKESEYQQNLAYHRSHETTDLLQKPEILRILTPVQIEEIRAQGAFGAAALEYLQEQGKIQFTADEAEKVREHEAGESRLDRKHEKTKSRDQQRADFKLAKTKLDKELQIWESKLKVAHPSEVDRIREKVDAFGLESVTRATIEAMPEGDEKWRMMDAWERRVASS